ncbi:Cold shock domain-containing protein 4 [Diplonema papillatum]|nr:Cold shock domain-containing protein 4 [Diplonema papillatum]
MLKKEAKGHSKNVQADAPGPRDAHRQGRSLVGQQGFGFIQRADNDGEVFVHQTSIKMRGFRLLAEQQDVEFDVESDHMKKP